MKAAIFLSLFFGSVSWASDFSMLCADRSAIERVYHQHRVGTKTSFEETLPISTLQDLVRLDAKKETALRERYGVVITPPLLEGEVQRIDSTTKAPETLAEIKAALGNDPEKFAVSFAKPDLVDRLLRDRFENDDALHTSQRRAAESTRAHLLTLNETRIDLRLEALKKRKEVEVQDAVRWELIPRPSGTLPAALPSALPATSGPTTSKSKAGIYTNEATAQVAQVLSSHPDATSGHDPKHYFEDLPGELQSVLREQLRQPGDVSALIETPREFTVYLAKECTTESLTVAVCTFRKRNLEEWLATQPER